MQLKVQRHFEKVDSFQDSRLLKMTLKLSKRLRIILTRKYFVHISNKWANTGLFFVYFRSFQTYNTIFTTKQYEKMSKGQSSIWRRDWNPQPFEHESSPITTRPGLPPHFAIMFPCPFDSFDTSNFSIKTQTSLSLLLLFIVGTPLKADIKTI